MCQSLFDCAHSNVISMQIYICNDLLIQSLSSFDAGDINALTGRLTPCLSFFLFLLAIINCLEPLCCYPYHHALQVATVSDRHAQTIGYQAFPTHKRSPLGQLIAALLASFSHAQPLHPFIHDSIYHTRTNRRPLPSLLLSPHVIRNASNPHPPACTLLFLNVACDISALPGPSMVFHSRSFRSSLFILIHCCSSFGCQFDTNDASWFASFQ